MGSEITTLSVGVQLSQENLCVRADDMASESNVRGAVRVENLRSSPRGNASDAAGPTHLQGWHEPRVSHVMSKIP